ncbi:MAG TPA: HAMP domain-containing protein, partial [Acidimicrobiales bacterium]
MKLAGALVIPLVALVVVTALEVAATADEVDQIHDQASMAASTVGPPSVLSMIEDERNAASVWLLGLEQAFALPVEDVAATWDATDDAVATFRADVERHGGEVERTYRPAIEALGELEAIRTRVDGFTGARNMQNMPSVVTVFDDYSRVMDTLFAANRQVTASVHDAELRRGAELADLSARQTDLIARIVRDLLETQLSGDMDGVNDPDEVSLVGRHLGQLRMNERLITTKAQGAYRPMAQALFADEDVRRFPSLVDAAIASGNVDLVDVADAAAGDDPDTFGYTVFRGDVTEQLQAEADATGRAADGRLRQYIAIAGLATAAALIATWLVSRSITRPLRSLTRQATEMSEHRLPTVVLDILETPLGDDVEVPETVPVRVRTRDEVADVADALNTVQDTAVDLAAEQAVLRRNIADSFVNLGRRNQNLLGRQLDFIT